MNTSKVKFAKGLVHLGLAVAPLLEIKESKSKLRNILLGIAVGWHASCATYHFFIEKDE